jgi:thiamine-phosphate pyrophosphorylase
MLRYAITDRRAYSGDDTAQQYCLVAQAQRLARAGVHYLQLREKDLPIHDRVGLAIRLRVAIGECNGKTRLLFNGSPSLALLAGADGVHLPGNLLQRSWNASDFTANGHRLIVSASCHTLTDIDRARTFADVLLFAPVFEKNIRGSVVRPGVGLDHLRQACHIAGPVPVLALGGVDESNVAECMQAGAAGFGGIRPFLGDV